MEPEPIYQVKLLAALRSGDPALIHPFLAEIGKDRKTALSSSSSSSTSAGSDGSHFALLQPVQVGEEKNEVDTGAAALHLAIRCASVDTVALLLSHRAISPNGVHPPGSGTTPLHLAASLGRVEIVNLLLEQDLINDTLRDNLGRSAKDVAKSREVIRAIDDSRSLLNATFRSQLHSYILSPFTPSTSLPLPQAQSPPGLVSLLESPRARFIDLSYIDDDSGTSLLHEAARRKDLRLIELAVRAGADVFVRNRKGKTAYEGAGKDDQVRVFLRQYANHDNMLIHSPNNELPTLKGYLNKYTNVAKGYNTRWFVLRNGILSYYQHQEDETVASRGSISMKNAILKSSNDRLRFEVHSVPARPISSYSTSPGGDSPLHASIPSPHQGSSASGGVQKWYIKANHPVEAARWTTAIERSIQYFKREAIKEREKVERESKGVGLGIGLGSGSVSDAEIGMARRKSRESDSSYHRNAFNAQGSVRNSYPSQTVSGHPSFPGAAFLRKAARSGGSIVREVRYKASLSRSDLSRWGTITGGHAAKDSISMCAAEAIHSLEAPVVRSSLDDVAGADEGERAELADEGVGAPGGEEEEDTTSSLADSITRGTQNLKEPPYEPGFGLHANSVTAQLELTMQLAASLSTLSPPLSQSSSSPLQSSWASSTPQLMRSSSGSSRSQIPSSQPSQLAIQSSSSATQTQTQTVLTDSLSTLHDLVHDYTKMVNERERWYKKKLGEERGRQKVWEESLKVVVKEGEDLEKELKKRSRRRGSMFMGVGVKPISGTGDEISGGGGQEGLKTVPEAMIVGAVVTAEPSIIQPSLAAGDRKEAIAKADGAVPGPPAKPALIPPPLITTSARSKISRRCSISVAIPSPTGEDGDAYTTDDEDEFFDAIESNTLPNLVVHASLAPTPSRLSTLSAFFDVNCYTGYQDLRVQLELSADNRPSTSLWSVLKHSIGKDLTRISFPVFFNEPTSMLQRMAEDMEFSECLDAAAKESDQFMRIAYVAAFAMSNYSSTIGRIAKPFNPMLSETFEYVRLDKQYRYVSEQVSHHPPISACWAESPLWYYYGEVDAQNKFMGKSFEIRPTGIAHAELILPEPLGPGYPKAPSKLGARKVREHYTWKKVTTNVSGFILGSPTIDHYGDMVVTNHRTGDQCVLSFKPRGWRGKDAYEITGRVMDKRGEVVYDIAGRWNSQLVVKRCGNGSGMLHPDTFVSSPVQDGSESPISGSPEFILLWRNSEKPPGSPFNLTPFAITLNDCPRDSLRPYLAPTDCRLRPDQRAFELGKYELANSLKTMQEDKQRAMRKAREEGRVLPHRPRWFIAETDGDTGERVWNPVRAGDEGELEYWVHRESVFREGGGQALWTGVEDIFIEEPEDIKGL